jgi:hypothetical protein
MEREEARVAGGDWEGHTSRGGRWRMVALLAVGVGMFGLLARWGDDGVAAPGSLDIPGLLDVLPEATTDRPPPPPSSAESPPRSRPTRTPTPAPSPDPPTALDASWVQLPSPPMRGRDETVTVWADGLLLVWGGRSHEQDVTVFHNDGAALDPATGHWSPIPPGPVEGRAAVHGAWTGAELVVWGGMGRTGFLADGAAYDPQRRTWRAVSPAPLSPRGSAVLVWTGDHVLVAGGYDNASGHTDAARYDPLADGWHPVPDLPLSTLPWGPPLAGTATPDGPILFASEVYEPDAVQLARLRSANWSPLPNMPQRGTPHIVVAVAWMPGSGDLLAVTGSHEPRGFRARAWQLAVGAGGWTELDDPPLSVGDKMSAAVVDDDVYLVDSAGAGAVLDGATGGWSRLPTLSNMQGGPLNALAGGDRLLVIPEFSGDAGIRIWELQRAAP